MGMDAQLLGLGKYKKQLASYLDYPEDDYTTVPEGTRIVTTIFTCNSTTESRDLAEALNIAPWNFSQHYIPNTKTKQIDFEYIVTLFGGEVAEKLLILIKHGFDLIYLPNG